MLLKDVGIYKLPTHVYILRNKDNYILQYLDPGDVKPIDESLLMMNMINISIHRDIITITVEEVNYVYPSTS